MSAAIATTFVPTYDSEVDVLGLGAPPPPPAFAPSGNLGLARMGSHVEQSVYDDDDLFTVEVEDDAEGVNEMVAGEGLTSPVVNYDKDGNIDWASELLLLSHDRTTSRLVQRRVGADEAGLDERVEPGQEHRDGAVRNAQAPAQRQQQELEHVMSTSLLRNNHAALAECCLHS